MVKTLRHYLGRKITLTVGDTVYDGEIVRHWREGTNPRNLTGDVEYSFKTSTGESIPIGKRRVTIGGDGGLILKLGVVSLRS